jgi:hypothetical protein
MLRRPHAARKGTQMKVLRTHDVLPPKASEPDFRGLKRIMASFIVAIVVCILMFAVTAIREARLQAAAKPLTIHPCTCMGRCLRR